MIKSKATAAGILLGAAIDMVVGDPRRGHPVAVFGSRAAALEKRIYRDSRGSGVAYTAACVGAAAGIGLAADRLTRSCPVARTAVTAAATWAVLGGTTLAREGAHMAAALETAELEAAELGPDEPESGGAGSGEPRSGERGSGEPGSGGLGLGGLEAARERLPHLCGRDPSKLDAKEIARATVESIAENTSDAVVAPLLWGAVFGVPGLLAYRAINTLDAMVGHRSPRYERFGWASARLDDAANFLPARLTGLLTVALAGTVGGSPRRAAAVLRRDGHRHPSPNSGRCEAAFAGALGVRLGGVNDYGGRVEHRPELGDGPRPGAADIRRSVRLTRAVSLAALALTSGALTAGALTVKALAVKALAGRGS